MKRTNFKLVKRRTIDSLIRINIDMADARWMCNTLFEILWKGEEPKGPFSYAGGEGEDPKTRIRRIKSLNHL